ncbi:MAG: histidine kinase, partial [Rudanella sp.]|nr:histidine kinase [Rudanella sp.]
NLILKGGKNQVVFIENKSPFRFTRFDLPPDANATDQLVQVIRKDSQGFYWFGGHQLTRYDYDRKKATGYTRQNGKFPAQNVLGLCIDNRQNLWVASENGLLLYDRPHDRFQTILSDSVVSTVMVVGQFDKDHLLFGDTKNLYVMDLAYFYQTRQVRCKVFNTFNGFMGLEPKQDGYYRDSRGYLWITSGSVLSRLDPKRIDLTITPLLTYVTKVNEQRLSFVGKTATVDLLDGENSATFTMATVGDDRPFFTEYSYRVAGFVDAWSPWQTQNLITLTNLPGGEYSIQIRSRSGSFGTRQPAETTLLFRVSLPFWKAPNLYQKALLAFLALGVLIGLMGVDWYLKQGRIRKQQQAIQDRERQVQFLQVQTIQAQMNPHFIFNVLGTIQHLIVANDTEQAAANLLKLSHLMRNYLEASMLSNEEHGSLFAHEVPLAREIELLTMYIEFEQLQYEGRFTHEIVVEGKLSTESYQVPPLILQPYVENAIKHGLLYAKQTGHLNIQFATIDEEVLICTIEDNGVGRQRAREIQRLSLKKYRSRGTELVERRVELLNKMGYAISIETADRPTGGTVVTIHIGYQLDSTPEQT